MNDLFNSINAKPTVSWMSEQQMNQTDPKNIFDLFLQNDLLVTSEPIINPAIFLSDDYVFESNILVQIDELIDISIPFNKREDFDMNSNEKKRTFKFILSDGHFQFAAISKDFLPGFDPRIIPGIKMKILKGTKVKFGVLFLEEDKIEIIGGQSLDMKNKRHSMIIYDLQKYKNQQNRKNEFMNQILETNINSSNKESLKKTKSRKNPSNLKKSSLIITTEDESKNMILNDKNSNILNQSQNSTIIQNSDKNKQESNISNLKTAKSSFLDHDSSFDSDGIVKIPEAINNKKNGKTIFDQISSSSYSSDVEIINNIINKNESFNQKEIAQNSTKMKFLSDDDDEFYDYDFDLIQNNTENTKPANKIELNTNNSNISQNVQKNSFELTNMKIFTLSDLVKRENLKKTETTSSNPEIILLDGKIVECNELKIIKNKSSDCTINKKIPKLFFSMKCKIACGEKTIEMSVPSTIISHLLEVTPENWMNLNYNDQVHKYEECSKKLLLLKSPLFILSNATLHSKNNSHYFIVNEDFVNSIEQNVTIEDENLL